MGEVKVIKIGESVFAANDDIADRTRERLRKNGTFFINVMSAPGSGKTTLLIKLINILKEKYRIGVLDVDIESSLDAVKVADATGVLSIQINNGGLCHIDADMAARALEQADIDGLDILILENIGNLVCPAEFDVGSHKKIMLTSVPEGDDKPLKYPLMFQVTDAVIINKTDTLGYFDYDFDAAKDRILALNPCARIFFASAKTGEGVWEFAKWIEEQAEAL
jgi:hydrogenase nickel incorporation protein HypB